MSDIQQDGKTWASPAKSSPQRADLAIVEFAAVEYLAFEVDKVIVLKIARRGPLTARIDLKWHTIDINFGKYFNAQKGKATLLPGDKYTAISVKVSML